MFQRTQTKLNDLSARLNALTREIENDKAKLSEINEQKRLLTHQQNLYLAAIQIKMHESEVNIVGAAISQRARDEAAASQAKGRAYVPSQDIDKLQSKILKAEILITKDKAILASHGLNVDDITSDNLAELLQIAARKKHELSNYYAALSDKVAMNENTAALLASEIADCMDDTSKAAMGFKIR